MREIKKRLNHYMEMKVLLERLKRWGDVGSATLKFEIEELLNRIDGK